MCAQQQCSGQRKCVSLSAKMQMLISLALVQLKRFQQLVLTYAKFKFQGILDLALTFVSLKVRPLLKKAGGSCIFVWSCWIQWYYEVRALHFLRQGRSCKSPSLILSVTVKWNQRKGSDFYISDEGSQRPCFWVREAACVEGFQETAVMIRHSCAKDGATAEAKGENSWGREAIV